MPFDTGCEAKVKAETDTDWSVLQEIGYQGKVDHFTVPVGMGTDFASVPRPFVWLIPQYGRYTLAAILHDYLWRHEVPKPNSRVTLAEADAIFRRAMRELGVPFLRRWLMWAAVRLGALKKPGGTKRWIRDSWQVAPLLVVAAPVVLIPATTILVFLGLFALLEWIAYLPLRAGRAWKRTRGQSAKEVIAPELDLKST